MGAAAARQGDPVSGVDTHVVLVPQPAGGTAPTPLPHPFDGTLTSDVASDVLIEGAPAAVVGSVATNQPPHTPTPPGTSFQTPPSNKGTVDDGSSTVAINGSAAARVGDPVRTCNDPTDLPVSAITDGAAKVTIG